MGNKPSERMIGRCTVNLRSYSTRWRAAGVSPEDIDIVINTHLHFDHCGC